MNVTSKARTPLLDLDLLNTLVMISETGNFSAASELLFRTPSAVSMQVKRLEDQLGKAIFHRGARSVTPTEHGMLLITHARRVLALNRDIVEKFIAPEIFGIVRLGVLVHAAERYLPNLLRQLADTHPGIMVHITVENSPQLVQKVRSRQLDIAIIIVDSSDARSEEVETVYHEALAWAGLKNGIAVEQTPLPVSVWEDGCAWRTMGLTALEKQGRDYQIVFDSAHISGQKAAILADRAIALIPVSACDNSIIPLGPEHGLPEQSSYPIGMMTGKEVTAPVSAVADHLRATFADT
ncbi:LysR family transcriptional regulator [Pelagibius sp. Alg239-R121]|uniref:LysR family transcriptional regulator n=1 Tax=Pelagibius sp. Alg239-R121 TaxID=2993448 RepID=UPI0024A669A6|nr:LysR family transcriptional regulator [Pelagibius sp. Alg239-R121]